MGQECFDLSITQWKEKHRVRTPRWSGELASSFASTIGFSGSDSFLQQGQAFPLSAKSLA